MVTCGGWFIPNKVTRWSREPPLNSFELLRIASLVLIQTITLYFSLCLTNVQNQNLNSRIHNLKINLKIFLKFYLKLYFTCLWEICIIIFKIFKGGFFKLWKYKKVIVICLICCIILICMHVHTRIRVVLWNIQMYVFYKVSVQLNAAQQKIVYCSL